MLSPTALLLALCLLQLALAAVILLYFGMSYTAAFLALVYLSLALCIVIFDRAATSPTYKLLWLWIFILLPLGGELLYFVWGRPGLLRRTAARFEKQEQAAAAALEYDDAALRQLAQTDPGLACQATYLTGQHAPLYRGTRVQYFGYGEQLFPVLLQKLRSAERSIWMEYFIYNEDSASWQEILAILRQKAAAGVDVRMIYDAVGSLFSLPAHYAETLRRSGIRCHEFNPLRFSLHLSDYGFLNHRDHRKLCIIDGRIGFTGGVNMADEYFGRSRPYGYWKDATLLLEGAAVTSFSFTFLKMWNVLSGEQGGFAACRAAALPGEALPLVQPFDDTPLDTEPVSQNAYSDLLHRAQRYLWITTPYLIPDHSMIEALCLAAKCGVDVRIITPGVPDKKSVWLVTRSYYRQLLENGVHIYEYAPGFIHSKLYLCDDKAAIVGTANMDCRSLYLHFENCCAVYGSQAVAPIKRDFEAAFAVCRVITLPDTRFPLSVRLRQLLLRFFAPLL